ncbi:MAG: peptide synthetase, partial [Rhodobacteraceae bacterium]|nr:peptide synthetase [Paracoccaceae bacterium]
RGFRIEPGEIEARLQALGGVAQAVVMAREDVPGDIRLVAYVRLSSPLADAAMRKTLAAALPEYMVPAHFVTLDAFPLTPNGKVDRSALPAPKSARILRISDGADQPGGNVAAKIAEVWSRILGVPKVSTSDNFFDLGGHSLLAVQAHRELREALNTTRVNITDIFRYPRMADLAAHLETLLGSPETTAPVQSGGGLAEKARARSDAMARRRAMRASRQADSA